MPMEMRYLQLNLKSMIKQLFFLLSTVILSSLFLPWWTTSVIAFLWGFIFKPGIKQGALLLFLSLFALWAGVALFLNLNNHALLSQRMADVLKLGSPSVLILVTGLMGGLIALLPGLAGIYLRLYLKK
jgi:hypothetical protein